MCKVHFIYFTTIVQTTCTKDLIRKIKRLNLLYWIISLDVIGVVKNCGDVTTIIGKQSQKEITKRDLQIVDQSGMSVSLTLWGADVSTVLGCLLTFK